MPNESSCFIFGYYLLSQDSDNSGPGGEKRALMCVQRHWRHIDPAALELSPFHLAVADSACVELFFLVRVSPKAQQRHAWSKNCTCPDGAGPAGDLQLCHSQIAYCKRENTSCAGSTLINWQIRFLWVSVSQKHKWGTVSHPHNECVPFQKVFISPTKLTYSANTTGYIVLYCNRFITLLTHIQEKTQIWKKHF